MKQQISKFSSISDSDRPLVHDFTTYLLISETSEWSTLPPTHTSYQSMSGMAVFVSVCTILLVHTHNSNSVHCGGIQLFFCLKEPCKPYKTKIESRRGGKAPLCSHLNLKPRPQKGSSFHTSFVCHCVFISVSLWEFTWRKPLHIQVVVIISFL